MSSSTTGSLMIIPNSRKEEQQQLNLTRLVNLALNSSPKVGIVNFNLLKTLLIELINALNLQNYEPKFADDDTKNIVDEALKHETQHDEFLHLVNNDNNINNTRKESDNSNSNKEGGGNDGDASTIKNGNGITILTSDMKPISLERFHKLEGKLARLEQQISSLNSLPSNQQLIDKTKDMKKSAAAANNNNGPILEIWQYTQLSKRMESNEEGITKLTSLIQDLIGDMNDLKDGQNKSNQDIKSLNDLFKDLESRMKTFEKLRQTMVKLIKLI
jgi:hypothetical protein